MKKVLFVATVDSHILSFHIPYLKLFKEKGYEVHVATNSLEEIAFCDIKHNISFERKPLKINNLKAISQLKKIVNKENYDIIHCHTPVASVVTRIAAKKARKSFNTRVIYTAHGFHFYKGAPILNWILYYPVEKYLSKYTDTLITINNEDYNLAKNKFSKRCNDIQYIPGVGIDIKKFDIKMNKKEKHNLRKSLGLKDGDFVITCVGRLDKNKNQSFLINAMKELLKQKSDIHLLLIGPDQLNGLYQERVNNLRLENNIHFLGFRTDVAKILKISNVLVSSSKREGLPLNILEGLASKIFIIALDTRGVRDLIDNEVNGYIISNDQKEFIEKINYFYNNKTMFEQKLKNNLNLINEFELSNVLNKMESIYFRKKNVLHLLSSNSFSGAENMVCQIIKIFENNNEINMYYCSPKGPIKDVLKNKNIKYLEIKKVSIKNLRELVKKYNINIIHAHDVRASFIASFLFNSSKIISHIHGNHLYMRKLSLQSLLFNFVSKRFSHIFWVSKSSFKNYIFKKNIENKSSVLYNVIDIKEIRKKIKEDNNNYSFDIIFLGRLNEAKNPMRLLKILKGVIEKRNQTKCAIVGDGELYDKTKQYIIENNLTDNIFIYGYVNNPFKMLYKSKLMIMTSIHEGMPMVVLEAMSIGVPIVSTPTDGIAEILCDNCGYLSEDDNELINKCINLLHDFQLRKKMSLNAKKKFKKINCIKNYKIKIFSEYDK